MIAALVSEHPVADNMLTGPKQWRSQQNRAFILIFHHSDLDEAGKRPF